MLFAIVNTKGGVGKTTTAVNLAVAFHDRGFATALIDADEQRLSSHWMRVVEQRVTVCQAQSPAEIAGHLRRLNKDHQVIIGDGPKGKERVNLAMLLSADVVLVPLTPSPLDFRTVRDEVLVLIHEIQRQNNGRPKEVRIVLHAVDKRTKAARDVISALQADCFRPLESVLGRRSAFVSVAFRSAITRTKGKSMAKEELNALVDEARGRGTLFASLQVANG